MTIYRTKTYIAADWTGDQNLIRDLKSYNDSSYYKLSFSDAHDLKQASDTSLNCSIKRSLAQRMDYSKTFVLIVGNNTKNLRAGSTDGWIKVPCVLDLLSDVWYKKITIVKNKVESSPSEQLVYPEFYTYFYGGKNRLAIKLDNPGMETGCKIVVKNISKVNIDNIQWHLINSFFDETHKEVSTLQKCRFNVMIRPGESISVDSNAINQQASLVSGNNSFNIARFQEADFDFINFCRLEHGKNNLVFLTDVLDLEISIEYTLATELAF